ncbi:MAG: squalene--hopene cyclase [Planctomycetia bacterium]|nr:squalene--hopene cyclase [Planctomycetia bacterium]
MPSPPPDPPAPQFPGPAPRSKAVVGGLPWDSTAPLGPRVEVKPAAAEREHGDEPGWQFSWDRLRGWWDDVLARSPAFTTSLAVHAILLVVLALIGIRERAAERLRLELSFGAANRPPGAQREAEHEEAAPAVEIERDVAKVEPPAQVQPREMQQATPPPPPVPDPTATVAVAPATEPAGSSATPISAVLSGRSAESRQRLLGDGGGTAETESAVERALGWIVRQQRKDGLWSLQGPYGDGSRQENRLAASAMALLALQGAGNTPDVGEHHAAVAKAWKGMLRLQQADGTFDAGPIVEQHQMYAHGQITIALCEALGMTRDPRFAEPARRALDYALAAQLPDGGWRYQPPRPGAENRGDMSVTGWYLMALKSGEMAGLPVPAEAYERLAAFLDGVFVSSEKGYAYQINPNQKYFDFRPALTAEALLCRQYLGWRRDDPRLAAGVDLLLREAPLDVDHRRKNVYAWYYQTQVFHHFGGPAWDAWNRSMQSELVPAQVAGGREQGSWDPANDQWGHVGGRLFVTSLCACMLEVYYRHVPLYAGP